jgi:hypothetical protein
VRKKDLSYLCFVRERESAQMDGGYNVQFGARTTTTARGAPRPCHICTAVAGAVSTTGRVARAERSALDHACMQRVQKHTNLEKRSVTVCNVSSNACTYVRNHSLER